MRLSTRPLLFVAALALVLPFARTDAQTHKGGIRFDGDSVAHIVPRQPTSAAHFAIVNRDGTAALLLMDTTIVSQITDHGLERMRLVADSAAKKDTSNAFARMLTGAVMGAMRPILDNGIAYHLRDLGHAEYRDGRLVIQGKNGKEVFGKMNVNGHELMEGFSPDDSREFARRAEAAAAKLR
jgi:hypothetical protein